ncbi:uncharacterized protein LOC113677537, partial [Pocillopora damicornis]|uniref:uncharacterized protein LOC113677537 n=1 Tax=Pocillopora damicornis TaxID=46731 RepID=UPI000F54DF8D
MQTPPCISVEDEEISDTQNDPVVHELFEDAIEVLRLLGADEKLSVECSSSERCHRNTQQGKKCQPHPSHRKYVKKPAEITRGKRRKLERIKAPVTILRKAKQLEVSSEEQEVSVQKMLSYVNQMPHQENFQPPPLPFVSFGLDGMNEHESLASSNSLGPDSITQDHTYLSSEKDVALWKTLTASPNNCNIFVGGLHYGVVSEVLHTAFKAFCLKEEDEKKMKVELRFGQKSSCYKNIFDVTAFVANSMQEFEIYGHCMQLGWGQEKRDGVLSNTKDSLGTKPGLKQCEKVSLHRTTTKTKGNIVSDRVFSEKEDLVPKTLLKRCTSRWDQETPRKIQKIEKLVRNPLPLYSFHFDTECNSLSGDQFKTDNGLDKNKIELAQMETRIAALCKESVISHGINIDAFEGGNEAVSSECSYQINLEVNNKTSSILPEIGQDPTYAKTRLENNKEIEDTGKHLSGEFEVTCE